MEIKQNTINKNHVSLCISLSPKDYLPKVEADIKNYKKKITLAGFRQGHVPKAVIKKMYGTQILVEELNKLVNDNITAYLKENDIHILGDPIPANQSNLDLDINADKTYDFVYELGIEPDFEINALSKKSKVTGYEIKVDDKMISEEIDRIAVRYADTEEVETVEAKDVVQVEWVELDDTAHPKENGIAGKSAFPLDELKEKKLQKKFTGLKKGDSLDLEIFKIFDADKENIASSKLNLDKIPEGMGEIFRMTIQSIKRIKPLKNGPELYDKLFGKDAVKTEEEYRQKIKEELEQMLKHEADVQLNSDIVKMLINNTPIDMPESFLKKWLKETSKESLSDEDMDKEFEPFIRNLKWNLIVNKIVNDQNIKVEPDDVENRTKEFLKLQYGFKDDSKEAADQLNEIAHQLMHNEDHVKKTYESLRDVQLFEYLKNTLIIKTKKISYKQFKELENK